MFSNSPFGSYRSVKAAEVLATINDLTARGEGEVSETENLSLKSALERLRNDDLKTLLQQKSLPYTIVKAVGIERLMKSYEEGIRSLTEADKTFNRVFVSWIWQPKSPQAVTHKVFEIGHANEPVMFAQLSSFLCEVACADIGVAGLVEVGLVVQSRRPWFGPLGLS